MGNTTIPSNLFEIDSDEDKLFYKLNTQYPWRTLYRGFIPKVIRKHIEVKLDRKKQNRISQTWDKLLKLYFNGELEAFNLTPKKVFQNQRIIWQYWGQDCSFSKLPETVQICFNSVERYKGDYQVIRLNDKNLNEYLDLPDFITEKRTNPAFRYVFFSDLLRFALLNTYGGIWIDATVLLTAPISVQLTKQDFFLFQREINSPNKSLWNKSDGYFSWHPEHKINCLSSFIISSANHPISHTALAMLMHFWKTQNNIPHYFFLQIMLDLVLNKHLGNHKGIIIDDTIPHLLHKVIKKEFNLKEYQSILSQTNIHKLTYIKKYKDNSFFAYLKQEFL